jgi:hypothetical protein
MKAVVGALVGMLLSVGVCGAQEKASPAPVAKQVPTPAGFHLVLLLAQNTQGSSPANLPGGAAKALKDAATFLPFKSYALLDSALVRGARPSSDMQAIRLQGPDGDEYVAYLSSGPTYPAKDGEWFVHIKLVAPVGDRTILTTGFSMQIGETVVVGTSKVKGQDQAVVVLLSALKSENLVGKDD